MFTIIIITHINSDPLLVLAAVLDNRVIVSWCRQ